MEPSAEPQVILFLWSKYTYVYDSGYSKQYYYQHGSFWKIQQILDQTIEFFFIIDSKIFQMAQT